MTDEATRPTFTGTDTWRVETRNVRSEIVDGPTLTGAVSRQRFVAVAISAMWQRIDDRRWTLFECKVSGPLLLRGGARSTKTRLTRNLAHLRPVDRPAWVTFWLIENGP
jgi:hypothetical protein